MALKTLLSVAAVKLTLALKTLLLVAAVVGAAPSDASEKRRKCRFDLGLSILRVFSVEAAVMWILARAAGRTENNRKNQLICSTDRQYRGCAPHSRCAATNRPLLVLAFNLNFCLVRQVFQLVKQNPFFKILVVHQYHDLTL